MTPRRAQSFSTRRPVAILMVVLAAVVFGALSYGRLPVQLMPELSYPTLTVRTEYEGAAPEEVENDVTRPIEEAVGVVNGLHRLASVSRADISDVTLEFTWDTDMDEAAQDVLERLDLVFLPAEAERPLILRYDPNLDPVLELSLSGEGELYEGEAGLRRLRRLAELRVKRALEPIRGVAAARVVGGLEEEIHVLLDEEQLRRTGIPISRVIERLREENVNVAGGTLQDGRIEYMVRTLNEFTELEQIAEAVVTIIDGREIRVGDLGRVISTHKEREIVTKSDGRHAVRLEIFKEGDANIVAVSELVRKTLGRLPDPARDEANEKDEGEGLAGKLYTDESAILEVSADRSTFIESSINEVRNTALLGGLLAIAVLFLFLRRFRPTAIIAVAIPISLLVTFAPLKLLGVSLNIMSLGGLALGVGMLVDSSIVVLEAIQRRREEGDDLETAAVIGTGEVRGAVIASTLTSIAVFAPMVFVEGVAGQAFGDLGLAVVVSLLVSTAVALSFIPMLASRGREQGESPAPGRHENLRALLFAPLGSWRRLRSRARAARGSLARRAYLFTLAPILFVVALLLELVGRVLLALFLLVALAATGLAALTALALRLVTWPLRALTERALGGALGAYPRMLRTLLAHPIPVLVGLVAIGWGTFVLARGMTSELLPEVHQGEFTVEVALPVGTPLPETERLLTPVEAAILDEREHIDSLLLQLGYDSATSERSDEGEHTARFKVVLDEAGRRPEVESAVMERLRERFAAIPDLETRIVRPVLFTQRPPVEVEILGEDLLMLRRLAEVVRDEMAQMTQLTDVETTQRRGAPEVQVVYDRDRLALYDLQIAEVATLVRDKVRGTESTRFNLVDRRIPILVRLGLEDRETIADVRDIVINPGGETPIPLSAVAQVSLGEGPSEVRRLDGERVALVRANLASGSLSEAVAVLDQRLESAIDWPIGTSFRIAGQSEEWERSSRSLFFAMALAVFFVYVIMAAQFESLIHPLVIMLTIPLAFVGTIVALVALDIPLSIVVFLGMIMLAGIVVNNAIVLVDTTNQLRREGLAREAALVRAGSIRLRPILMTTATTVLGLSPLALGLGDGAELRSPMAIAVISGLLSSTLLTLLVVPTVYSLLDRAAGLILGRELVTSGSAASAEAVRP